MASFWSHTKVHIGHRKLLKCDCSCLSQASPGRGVGLIWGVLVVPILEKSNDDISKLAFGEKILLIHHRPDEILAINHFS